MRIPKALGTVIFSIRGTTRFEVIIAYETPSALEPKTLKTAVKKPIRTAYIIWPFLVIGLL